MDVLCNECGDVAGILSLILHDQSPQLVLVL